MTSAFKGLMGNWNRDVVGDGEGGDLKVFGTTIYSQLIYVVTFKVRKHTVVSLDLPQPASNLFTHILFHCNPYSGVDGDQISHLGRVVHIHLSAWQR